MKKIIQWHIKQQNFVKVYIQDKKGFGITHFEGILFAQSKEFLWMSSFLDFNYDGFVLLRKDDIYEIKHTKNEQFFNKIITAEKIKAGIVKKAKKINLKLGSFKAIFTQIKAQEIPVIIECRYGKDDRFIIGNIMKAQKKVVQIMYINAKGMFDFKPTPVLYKGITFVRVGSPYTMLFDKYSRVIK